jgi:hypothetical protein
VLAKMESAVRVETAASMSMGGGGGLVRGEIERDWLEKLRNRELILLSKTRNGRKGRTPPPAAQRRN